MIQTAEPFKWANDAYEYWRDSAQRSILYGDVMRKRGNVYLDHLRHQQPPVLVFDHEMIEDGRDFEHPVNYALVRIIDRRCEKERDRRRKKSIQKQLHDDHRELDQIRRHKTLVAKDAPKATARPIVIIDPRAGHGPGIGGSKQDSQIGMALDAGHPVYFMIFFIDPVPGQTLADVRNAQIKFIETIGELHPKAQKPAIIGNCQGGWAAALIGAERPDLVGPMVFNGSPLSYWGGVEGVNPMRYLGGLLGGVWINSFLSDLGNNKFDGANLVDNFEKLNPANTLWAKQYHLYSKIDTEEKRYLDFEKWWGGFFSLSGEEIHTIVDGLFVGNKLEQGEFELDEGRNVDLKHNNNPVVVFASFGDNITPPQQAFNWIIKTYGTVNEIKRRGQVIVCIGHENIGHLGIFVSAKIARKEHKEIIASFDMLDWLPPGLYKMAIEEDLQEPGEYNVSYSEMRIKDIMAFDDGLEDEKAFYPVRTLSKINDIFYRLMVSPWVKLSTNDFTAETLRQLHPQRTQRYMLSDLNPWLLPLAVGASLVKNNGNRHPVSEDNVFSQMEKYVSDSIVDQLDNYRKMRDNFWETTFKSMYETPWMGVFHPFTSSEETKASGVQQEKLRRQDAEQWRDLMGKGDLPEAIIRILLAVGLADQKLGRKGYALMAQLIEENSELKDIRVKDLKQIVQTQARILQTDTDQAIEALPQLMSTKKKRQKAMSVIKKAIKLFGREPNISETAVLDKIRAVLQG